MKYLILGSKGQIGSHLVDYINRQGDIPITYDIRDNKDQDLRLFGNRKKKLKILCEYIKNCDFVFFLAWDVGGSKYLCDAEKSYEFINNNIAIMSSTFPILKLYKKPFIFASSQMALMAHSTYGNTKLIGERYTKFLNGVSVRLWNVYGNEQVNKRSHVITDFVDMAFKGTINMLTDGTELRQFLYVEDCCEALYIISKKYKKFSSVDISSFKWVSIKEIAIIISNLLNCQYKVGKLTDSVQMSLQEEPDKTILKYWKPKFSLRDGIKEIIKGKTGV